MISPYIEALLLHNQDSLIIEAKNVANVGADNTLLHAMLVLSSVGFSKIPVRDAGARIVGLISMPMIIENIKEEFDYNWDLLHERKVRDAMTEEFALVTPDVNLETVLNQLTTHNFICVADQDKLFLGIITRREILSRVNFMVHEFDHRYDITPKSGNRKNKTSASATPIRIGGDRQASVQDTISDTATQENDLPRQFDNSFWHLLSLV